MNAHPTTFPVPPGERKRLEILRSYEILDTRTEQAFDDFTELAAAICEVPIALISLVDEDRQWFKSKVGMEADETPRNVAFCAHAIMDDQVMVVPDAHKDSRFAENLLVTGSPNIRFYAGAPLISPEGQGLGTLCVIDREPRELNPSRKSALQALARQLMTLLEHRKTSRKLAAALRDVKTLEGLLPICSHCKGIRDDQGIWSSIEQYLGKHTDAQLSHGYCRPCMKKHYPEIPLGDTQELPPGLF